MNRVSHTPQKPLYFVWIKTNTDKPAPQLWYDDQRDGAGNFQNKAVGDPEGKLLEFYVIPPNMQDYNFQQLIEFFPYTKTMDKSGAI